VHAIPSNILPEALAGHVDHIGVAVADLEAGIALYSGLLGLELERTEEVAAEHVRVAFLKLDRQGGPGHLELLAPLGAEGNIARHIEKRGPGLHHVAIAVGDIQASMARCREAGIRLLDDTPRTGAGGKQIVFLHPKDCGGVLVEMCAPAK